jgi:hypothetical protein
VDRDHDAISDRENVLAEAVELLDLLAVAVEESVVLDPAPVDRKGCLKAIALCKATKAAARKRPSCSRWPRE